MPISISDALATVARHAAREGLSRPFVTSSRLNAEAGVRLQQFLQQGHHGSMEWMTDRLHQRQSPDALWPEAKSAIVFAQTYGQGLDPMQRLEAKHEGVISTYALNRDYHEVFKGKLKQLAQVFHQRTKHQVKVFVDTAPVMEKPLAAQAGLGWQGKHTNLVSRDLGSWFFIGTILTTAELDADAPEADHCGTCTACLDICPTKAFPAPRQLDARRCISYLTIEHTGHIAEEFRRPMGNRIYGCDDCLAVCPWNKFAQASSEIKLQARAALVSPQLIDLLQLDEAGFRSFFSGSPVKRTGRNRFLRNCLIAAGNSGDRNLLPVIEMLLQDVSPLVRAMAVWASAQLMAKADFAMARHRHGQAETDADVLLEWRRTGME
jgi:epoxyqueuosine reductase